MGKHLDSAVVRALTSHQHGPGSDPCIDAIILCWLSLLLFLCFTSRGFSPVGPKMVDKVNHFVDVLPLNCCVFIFLCTMYVCGSTVDCHVNTMGFFAHTLKLEPLYETLLYTLKLIKGIKFWVLRTKFQGYCRLPTFSTCLWLKLKLKNANCTRTSLIHSYSSLYQIVIITHHTLLDGCTDRVIFAYIV